MIDNNGPLAVQAILRSIHETEGMHENDAFKIDTKLGISVFLSDDAKEGPLAFKEKRAPQFKRPLMSSPYAPTVQYGLRVVAA